jgi:hypothetical protein
MEKTEETIGLGICSICKREFQKTNLFYDRKKCWHCWMSEQNIHNSLELNDLYIHGTLLEVVIYFFKIKHEKKELDLFLKELKETEKKDELIRKTYLAFRPNYAEYNLPKRYKKIKLRKDRHIYKDECPYCHNKIYLNRVHNIGINCKGCGKYIYRANHPTDEFVKEMLMRNQQHREMLNKSMK